MTLLDTKCETFYNFTELEFLHIERDEKIVILPGEIATGETSQFFFVEHPVDGY